jgi:transcriptional regulator
MSNGTREPDSDRKIEILQGTLDLMVLRTLAALGPQHGYAIAARIEQVSDGSLQLNMGTLYPALVRLEQKGFVRSKWNTTDNNRRARFYEITAAGKKHMHSERANWLQMASIMSKVLAEEV